MKKRAEAWLGAEVASLERLVQEGWLTEADGLEVDALLDELLERLRAGAISQHFVEVVIRRLAHDKAEKFRQREEGQREEGKKEGSTE